MVQVILNCLFTASTAFHEVLHIFWLGCSTGAASLEAKLIQQLTAMMEEVLYTIFIDLHKSYDALDRDRCLGIVEGC